MDVREFLLRVAKVLGLENEMNYIKTAKKRMPEFENLVLLTQVALNDLCMNHIDYKKKEKFKTIRKRYKTDLFESKVLHVLDILQFNNSVQYKQINRELVLDKNGEYECLYRTVLEIRTINDDLDEQIEPYLKALELNTCALWCLRNDRFDLFRRFHFEYKDELAEALRRKNERMGNKNPRKR